MSSLKDKIRLLLKVIVSGIFLVAGMSKVNPYLNSESYAFMDSSFQTKFTPVWQKLIFDLIGHKVHPVVFKYMIGNTELGVSVLLWGTNSLSLFACLLGIFIMISAIITHLYLNEDYIFPLVVGILFILIFFLSLETKPKVKKETQRKNKWLI